jgi:hypothetical protein
VAQLSGGHQGAGGRRCSVAADGRRGCLSGEGTSGVKWRRTDRRAPVGCYMGGHGGRVGRRPGGWGHQLGHRSGGRGHRLGRWSGGQGHRVRHRCAGSELC